MSDHSTHIIQRQHLHVTLNGSQQEGLALQAGLSELCQTVLMPAIEQVLDRFSPTDKHLVINHLELDLGEVDVRDWGSGLSPKIATQLAESIQKVLATAVENDVAQQGGPVLQTHAGSVFEAFLYFLRKGVLPWNFMLPTGKNLEAALWEALEKKDERAPWEQRLRSILAKKNTALRLANLRHPQLVQWLETQLLQNSEAAWAFWQKQLEAQDWRILQPKMRFSRWELAQKQTIDNNELLAHALGLLTKGAATAANDTLEKLIKKHQVQPETGRDADPPTETDHEGAYVANAGLIVLHPFIPMLFERTGIAQNNQIVDAGRALLLLHYLCTGFLDAPEYDAVLAKTLCNIAWETPIVIPETLAPEILDEADSVLASAIKYWDALGNTDANNLRGSFLLRPGKLTQVEGGDWYLQVETRSYDILLDRIPWTISMLQLPWMPATLQVDWVAT